MFMPLDNNHVLRDILEQLLRKLGQIMVLTTTSERKLYQHHGA